MSIFKKKSNIKIDLNLIERAKSGDPKYQLIVSDEYYRHGKYEQSFEWCKKAADQLYKDAYFKLSCFYLEGNGCKQDLELACKYLEKAANNGDNKAEFNLAAYYINGRYFEKNNQLGLMWLKRSADHGNRDASILINKYKSENKKVENKHTASGYDEVMNRIQKEKEESINRLNERFEKAKKRIEK